MEKIGFILHGKVRGKKEIKESLIAGFSLDYSVRFYETIHPRHAEHLTDLALHEGCDFVIAVGGDGTLNEVVNGYLNAGGNDKFNASLGVLPLGTGNDFARNLKLNKSIGQLEHLVKSNQPRLLDAGKMEMKLPDGSTNTRFFDNIADLGFGAEVVARVNGVHLRKILLGGTLTFVLAILRTFSSYRHKNARITWDGFEWEGKVLCLVVAKGRYFGSGVGVAPGARPDDGMFEVVIFADLSIMDYLRYYSKLRRLEKIDHPEVTYHRTNKLCVESTGKPIIIEADGEIEGHAPVVFTCLPGALRFLVP
ncbi:MAG: diacylglycerol kinase family lipid kinase [Bacteroidales bacterium]|nr:diacylglycerol kinase family lipid kinase [Bacteroidales bacterium]